MKISKILSPNKNLKVLIKAQVWKQDMSWEKWTFGHPTETLSSDRLTPANTFTTVKVTGNLPQSEGPVRSHIPLQCINQSVFEDADHSSLLSRYSLSSLSERDSSKSPPDSHTVRCALVKGSR